ncbi:hypothetical protein H072_8965 [Dactylellina haptotyla CBS 200.50]|uniref:Uncharacterized protein n=1 Tax=Dactylellina haptotyla (strain CBS 200.50) TaxID=1284197 RepID=S8BQ67_DACHA|nr:hypothetical protein H072_8965 [Dactylellina haptotyla CBS 200.50]
MLSTETLYPMNYQNDTVAANIFHLTQLQRFQPNLQPPLTNPIPPHLQIQDDLSTLDFSNPSIQEYLNSDVLDSLDQTAILGTVATSVLDPTANIATGLCTDLLLNTPIAPPNSPLVQCHMAGTDSVLDVQVDQFSTLQEETTLSLGIMAHLENLEKQMVEMRRFLSVGFAKKDPLRSFEVERQRLYSRNHNFQNITEINEPFELLLRSNGELPTSCPVNGVELKSFNHEEMDTLLDEYDIPFNPSMFLHEKQLLYLRFIGANRAVMHRVVD